MNIILDATHALFYLAAALGGAAFVFAMLAAWADRHAGFKTSLTPFEWHHAYLGATLVLFSAGAWWAGARGWSLLTSGLGAVVLCDDGWQHLLQLSDPSYQSPLHRAYAKVLKWVPWLAGVGQWLDRLFHKNPPTP